MKVFQFYVRSMLNQLEFQICFGFLCLMSFGSFLWNCLTYYGKDYMQIRSGADVFFLTSTSSRIVTMIFSLIVPLIAMMLCAGYRKKGEKEGNNLFAFIRMGHRKYLIIGAIATIFVTIICFWMILGVNQILCRIVFPVIGRDNRWGLPMYLLPLNYNSKMFLDIWQVQNPYIYNIFYIFIIGILAGGISLVFYGASMLDIFKKMGLVQNAVFSFVFFIILVAIGQLFSAPMISFLSYVQVGQEVRIIDYGIFTGALYLLGILFTILGVRKYEYV